MDFDCKEIVAFILASVNRPGRDEGIELTLSFSSPDARYTSNNSTLAV
jgi:hypothetical protein